MRRAEERRDRRRDQSARARHRRRHATPARTFPGHGQGRDRWRGRLPRRNGRVRRICGRPSGRASFPLRDGRVGRGPAWLRGLSHPPAILRVAGRRVRGEAGGPHLSRPARGRRHLPERPADVGGLGRGGDRVLPAADRRDAGARDHGPRTEDRVRIVGGGRAAAGRPRAATLGCDPAGDVRDAPGVPCRPGGDVAGRMGRRGVRRADPRDRRRSPGRCCGRLRGGHRVRRLRPGTSCRECPRARTVGPVPCRPARAVRSGGGRGRAGGPERRSSEPRGRRQRAGPR